MPQASKIFLTILLLLCFGFAVWFIHHRLRTPQNQSEVMDRQIELVRAGGYAKAIQVIETWMKDSRGDLSHDGMLYQQMAIAYFGKARSKPTGKRESIRQTDLNLEKALDLYNQENAAGLRVDCLRSDAGTNSWEIFPTSTKCLYYGKGDEELTRQLSLVKGDSCEADGKSSL